MDEDPFSHFISSTSHTDDQDEEPIMMSAGIHNTESVELRRDRFCANLAHRWARSVRAKQQFTSPHTQTSSPGNDRMALSEPGFSDMEVREPSWIVNNNRPDIPRIVVTEWDAPTRDRSQTLLMEARRLRRRRRTSRTLSGHRHSWQEPSPDLYTVLEEGFNNDVAVESASDGDFMDTDDDEDEELNSEDEALYAEDDDFEMGWPDDLNTRPPERARL